MPSDRTATHLEHILNAIERIEGLTLGMDQAAYKKSDVIKLAVELLLQNLTEAANRLGKEADVICPEVNWRDIRDMGNVLRHDYDQLIDSTVWNTVAVDLPPLKAAAQGALDQIAQRAAEPSV